MKNPFKLVGTIFIVLGGAASLLEVMEKFFPGSSSVFVMTIKDFIINDWLTLIVIGLLISILVLLVKENGGAQSSDKQTSSNDVI